ncbi:Glycerophosphodiester phosphodiesterase domain [Dillenia turbinata]|uniref:glycerophosphodiester phosphodiesterase n=1 Tax=Dillenia turbinata TaxID=194707 RepID=A0AAN8VGB3_9MAGN
MRNLRSLVVLFVLHLAVFASAQGSTSKWQTLNGSVPLVIARGGFSGLFPDSSSAAYNLALLTSVSDVVLWCDVQLTKDSVGICFPNLNLDNASDISNLYKNKEATYPVNGVPVQGWFSVDFTLQELSMVSLMQSIYSRTSQFDGNLFSILTVQDVFTQMQPPGFWLNIQHNAFYVQHGLSMRNFLLNVSKSVIIDHISSPELNFLSSIAPRFKATKTKLIFRFLGQDDIEPTTNQTYNSLLQNLTYIKTFASGILVPKTYIWPSENLFLQPCTSVVQDAHKQGLEIFAADFVNDSPLSYNYSYDPVAEIMSFIDNGNFSVDGVLSDFPITPSEAIDCFSHIGKNRTVPATPLIISYDGASGDRPSCTDVAYMKAISDGADVIDCNVQMTKDGIPFCLGSINLITGTNAAQTNYSKLATSIPEILSGNAIFSFSLTWAQIQGLSPQISNPYSEYRLYRNPAYRTAGNLISLTEFLALAKNQSSLSGVLIKIENAAYLAEKKGLDVVEEVLSSLREAGYDTQKTPKVMIESTNSSVLVAIKEKANYELVYEVDEYIRDALNATIEDIKTFASAVIVRKTSIYPDNQAFLIGVTNVVPRLKAFNLPVYARLFSNEFVSQAWDFFSDATVEINSFVTGAGVDGVITDFPRTSAQYRRNKCLGLGNKTPPYMSPVQPGSLMQVIPAQSLPPAEAPFPVLTEAEVNEAPLPAVEAETPAPNAVNTSTSPPPTKNGQPKIGACVILSHMALFFVTLLLL